MCQKTISQFSGTFVKLSKAVLFITCVSPLQLGSTSHKEHKQAIGNNRTDAQGFEQITNRKQLTSYDGLYISLHIINPILQEKYLELY